MRKRQAPRGQKSAAGARRLAALSRQKLLRRIRGVQPQGSEEGRPLGASPRPPTTGGTSPIWPPADVGAAAEPHEHWFVQRALTMRRMYDSSSVLPPFRKRVDRPWQGGQELQRYNNCSIWRYEHREHGPVISKVVTQDPKQGCIGLGFEQEVDMLSRLRGHPNLIRLVDVWAAYDEVAIMTQWGGGH